MKLEIWAFPLWQNPCPIALRQGRRVSAEDSAATEAGRKGFTIFRKSKFPISNF
ncbi:hypothetical protein L6307_03635 [Candidatus Parcubacteria bacterium]|nr:hypothetical protein [Candidatus Parcubacteria bacterium]